ncbi:phage tail assembly protein [Bradyrhizobium sp. AZCC 2289]|uniref:phage tail assembly protein n=1 Tax=Bradyrhizobium sp. AZCC 2289 TaxID=3117026 RepID=UPI002FF05C46
MDDQAKPVEHEQPAPAAAPGTKRAAPPPEIEPSPEEMPPLEQDEWPIIVTLKYKPIRNNRGDEITQVELREPRAGDINRYGNPVRFNREGDIVHDERKMTYMIAALTGILPPFIEEMHPRDWNTCAYKLQRFFLPDPAAW